MKQNHNKIRIVITGGGSGGHIEPALAVANILLKDKNLEVFWIGEKNGSDNLKARSNINFSPISVGKVRRYASFANLTDAVKTTAGYFQSISILRRIKPDVVFSKSGYVSAPVVLAAKTCGIPIVIHESDSVLGLTNRFAIRFARKVCVGFPIKYYPSWIRTKAVYTGNPVKDINVSSEVSERVVKKYNLNGRSLVILGGSQGSVAINRMIWSKLPAYLQLFNVVHQVGINNINDAVLVKDKLSSNDRLKYHPSAYFNEEELTVILKNCTLAICRSGAGTIADLSHYKVPAILIPLPSAAGNHQRINAWYVEKIGGALLFEQLESDGNKLYNIVTELMADKHKLMNMSEEISSVNPSDASEHIAKIIRNEVRI